MAKKKDDIGDLIRVQHAVFIKTGSDLRGLNDLLSTGWHVATSAELGDGVLMVLEKIGTEDTIVEMRTALGYEGLPEAEEE